MFTTHSLTGNEFGRVNPVRLSLLPTLVPSIAVGRRRQRPALTDREIAVAGLLADGLSSRDIEEMLQIPAGEVGSTITSLHFTLGVRSRAELSSALAELE